MLYDSKSNAVTEFSEVSGNRVVPVDVVQSSLPSGGATSAKQLPNGHEVEVNNLPTEFPLPADQVLTLTPPAAITGFATSDKQLPDNHQVTVSNPTADPETGLAKESTLTDGSQKTKIVETVPTDPDKTNPSVLISYNAAGEAVYVDETIGAVTYRQTFTRSDMVVDSTLPISAVVAL